MTSRGIVLCMNNTRLCRTKQLHNVTQNTALTMNYTFDLLQGTHFQNNIQNTVIPMSAL